MVRQVTAENFQQNLGEMLNQVRFRNDTIVIEENGADVAALVDPATARQVERLRERFEAVRRKIADAYKDVPEAEGMAEIEELIAQERRRP